MQVMRERGRCRELLGYATAGEQLMSEEVVTVWRGSAVAAFRPSRASVMGDVFMAARK
jgi:hypothetical protein